MLRRGVFALLLFLLGVPGIAQADFVYSDDGATVTDTFTGVTWLTNFDLAGTLPGQPVNPANLFGVAGCSATATTDCINANGTMDLPAAQAWINGLNAYNHGQGYLGHDTWQLPSVGTPDAGCSATGPAPNSNPFAFGCANSALGRLYSDLGRTSPASVVRATAAGNGAFVNFQPALYWSGTQTITDPNTTNGYQSFSFATGWQGSNVGANKLPTTKNPDPGIGADFQYVLPMAYGRLPGLPPVSGTALVYDPATQTVYDPVNDVTWMANANLPLANPFGLPSCPGIGNGQTPCIGPNGSMNWTSANQYVQNMSGYLGATWVLPPTPLDNGSCSETRAAKPPYPAYAFGFDCGAGPDQTRLLGGAPNPNYNPMGYLFYNQLTDPDGNPLTAGESVDGPAADTVGLLTDMQPYFYWGCTAIDQSEGDASSCYKWNVMPPANDFGWSFNLDEGFQSTDVVDNEFYVTAMYVVPEPGTAAIFLLGAAGAAAVRMRRRVLRQR